MIGTSERLRNARHTSAPSPSGRPRSKQHELGHGRGERGRGGGDARDGEAVTREPGDERFGDRVVVLDEQHVHRQHVHRRGASVTSSSSVREYGRQRARVARTAVFLVDSLTRAGLGLARASVRYRSCIDVPHSLSPAPWRSPSQPGRPPWRRTSASSTAAAASTSATSRPSTTRRRSRRPAPPTTASPG